MTRTFFTATTSLSAAFAVLAVSSLGLAQDPLAPEAPTPPTDPANPADRPLDPAPPELTDPSKAPAPAKTEPVEPAAPGVSAKPTRADPTLTVREEKAPVEAPKSWFYRDPLALKIGNRLSIRWYGVVQADFIYDTTRSYGDTIGQSLVAREDTYEGTVGRFQASSRSTRFGMAVDAKTIGGVTPSGVLEADFAGDQPTSSVGGSERSYYDSPNFRLRHAYLKLANDYVDVLIGQTDDVFGWQNTPSSVSRHTQFRLSHTFGAAAPVGLDIAAAALRPAQRDSRTPDGQAGLRFTVNEWKGIYARDGIPSARKLSIGVSGVARQFDVDAYTPPPTQTSNKVVGWGLAIDAMIPVIPADDEYDRSNRLTLAGSYVRGTGIGDLMRVDGGAEFTPLPNPTRASPPPEYDANVDQGLVSFDRLGVLNTIDWEGFRVDAQYYFPGGRVRLQGIYTQAYSKNMSALYPQGGTEIDLLTHIADRLRYVEGNLFWDVTPEVRLGTACIYTTVTYLDGENPYNIRGKVTGYYFF